MVRLNLNGLLVIQQIDNTSPGGGGGAPGGKLVPGSHKKSRDANLDNSDISKSEASDISKFWCTLT